jgi:peptidoglycan/xylan/chitin deacetylase (PgdA/CDA1 family)|tara:strand:+ start:769 stop:1692 length:924 start_codon:yes stop_codon:yes gene_type:complete
MKKNNSVMFHDFKLDNTSGTQGAISQNDFRKLIKTNGENKFSNPDVIQNTKHKNLEDESFITFDDGLLSQYDIALDLLSETDKKGIFFVHSKPLIGGYDIHQVIRSFKNSSIFNNVDDFNEQSIKILLSIFNTDEKDKIEKDFNQRSYLSEFDFYSDLDRKLRYIRDFVISLNQYEEGIKELLNIKNTNISDLVKDTYIGKEKLKKINQSGHVIALHSHSHPTNLGSLKKEEQFEEIGTNYEILEEIIGYKPNAISYPSNSYNFETIEILKHFNIGYGFRADDNVNLNPFELSRVDATIALRDVKNN